MTTKLLKTLSLLLLIFSCISCLIPGTKKHYLNNYERFVSDVEKNREKFSFSDWRWANERFRKYDGEWYDKFRNELNPEEKTQVSGLKTRYLAARAQTRYGRFMHEDVEKNLDKLKEGVKDYMKNDLDNDVRDISKGAREIGDSAKKVMEDVIKEIKKK
jgi:hypothetical protein